MWDANTRKKNDKKRLKKKKKEIEKLIEERRDQGVRFDDLLEIKKTLYDENGNVIFKTPFFDLSSESSEDEKTKTLNDILEDLFSWTRIRRKLFLVNRKRKRVQASVRKTVAVVQRKTQQIRKSLTAKINAIPDTTPEENVQSPEVKKEQAPNLSESKARKLILLKKKKEQTEIKTNEDLMNAIANDDSIETK